MNSRVVLAPIRIRSVNKKMVNKKRRLVHGQSAVAFHPFRTNERASDRAAGDEEDRIPRASGAMYRVYVALVGIKAG